MNLKHRTSLNNNQTGLASMIVTIILMMILSLIALSFANLIRREQRQQLDRQLSSRAFYAAESGVNVAYDKIKNGGLTGNTTTPCGAGDFTAPELEIDAATSTKVTCLTVDQSLETLEYNTIDNTSKVIPVNSSDGTPINAITISWQSTSASSVAGCPVTVPAAPFPTGAGATWACNQPLIRLDLVPTTGVLTRATLQTTTLTAFLYPVTGGTGANLFASAIGVNQGAIFATQCNAATSATSPLYCTTTINGLGLTNYTARVMSLYGTSKMVIFANSLAGARLELTGAQAMIDSTAKSNDVLRRIQVRKPTSGSFGVPDFGVQTGEGLCKRYFVVPPSDVTSDVPLASDPLGTCQIN